MAEKAAASPDWKQLMEDDRRRHAGQADKLRAARLARDAAQPPAAANAEKPKRRTKARA